MKIVRDDKKSANKGDFKLGMNQFWCILCDENDGKIRYELW